LIAFAAVVASSLVSASPALAGALNMPVIAKGGFGQRQNSYAWSMAWFKGALYVGTARDAACVERATIAFYYPWGSYYTTHPDNGVSCPPSIDDADLRAEIWRYTPRNGRWTLVYRSPTVPNPEAPGRRIARDIGYRGMVVFRDGGRSALFVGGLTADEFIPELAKRFPPRILVTTDGKHFDAVKGSPGVIHDTLGPRRPIGFRAMTVFDGRLYVTASRSLTGDGVVLRVDNPGGTSPRFTQVSPSRLSVFELATLDGHLYAGTGDSENGYGVWRTDGGRALRWQPVITDGAGRGATVTSVVSMATYRGDLYVGASGWGSSAFPSSELIRIAPSGTWDVVVGNARSVDGIVKAPLSGLGDGFGNPFNNHFWRMEVDRGALLLGTNDWSWSLNGLPGVSPLVSSEFGFDLYGTCDGNDWWVATRDGFGRPWDFGVRTMVSSPVGLFLGTTNLIQGTTIRRTQMAPCATTTATRTISDRPSRRNILERQMRLPRQSSLESDLATGVSRLTRTEVEQLRDRANG
jgi:hypothetical protein